MRKYISIICLVVILGCESTEKDMPAPKIYFREINMEKAVGDTVELIPKIIYDYNSSYKWYKNDEELTTERNIMHISTQLGEVIYRFDVETPTGSDSETLSIKTILHIDFDDFPLEENKYDTGENIENEEFVFDNILLPAKPLPDEMWEGFAMSNMFSTANNAGIYSAYAPAVKNDIFTMLHLSRSPEMNTINFAGDKNYVVGSISVCNSSYVYNITKQGDEELGIRRFEAIGAQHSGDLLTVSFYGYNSNDIPTGVVSFPLADYRFENKSRNYIVDKFTEVDLTPLGVVNKIVIEMTSSVVSDEGEMLTPPYVCLNNIKIYGIEE